MAEILDADLKEALRGRLKRFVQRQATTHADSIMKHPKGQRVAELAGYAFGIVTDRELDLDVPNEEFSRLVKRGTQIGRAIRKGTVSDD